MKERPILFSAPMVRRLNMGLKTQTRCIVKDRPGWTPAVRPEVGWFEPQRKNRGSAPVFGAWCPVNGTARVSPVGAPGDLLWVRESFALASANHWPDLPHRVKPAPEPFAEVAYFKASYDRATKLRWRPSIHMPRWASRTTLEIVGVRVEQLCDISEEDAIAEGVDADDRGLAYVTASAAFFSLWGAIHGAASVSANPWVWALTFRRVQP
jgi:hypothetical protein